MISLSKFMDPIIPTFRTVVSTWTAMQNAEKLKRSKLKKILERFKISHYPTICISTKNKLQNFYKIPL